jgi:uncharacterized protein
MIQELDVMVAMRDGVRIAVDIYRPEKPGKFPVIYACAFHNKDLQRPELAQALNPQPAWSTLWCGVIEAGDSKRLVANDYVHVVAQMRGAGKSEGTIYEVSGEQDWDHTDLMEWLVAQPWCDGNIGMIGISGYAGEQWRAAAQQSPHLKAIFPYDAASAYGGGLGFRDYHPGGVLQTMLYHISLLGAIHEGRGIPGELSPELEEIWRAAMANPDYMMYPNLYNILTQKGQRDAYLFHSLLEPYEADEVVAASEETFKNIKIPFYTGSGTYAYTYKVHLQGSQHWFQNVQGVPKKFLLTGPAHLERPFHSYHDEILRWYDYWLKGIDTGIMDEPPVKTWVMGANKWRTGQDWPLPETQWTKYYFHSWERLSAVPHLPADETFIDEKPDTFVQMPPSQTNTIQRLRYMTDPLPEDTLVIGPLSLTLYAALDQDDTNWIIVLKDIGPDVSVQTAREGERAVPRDLQERELTRGWLKASHGAVDPERSKPWAPWHVLTKQAQKPVVPGEVTEYQIEILSTANLFEKNHRICVEITSLDLAEGVCGETSVEYIPYHICSSRTVVHKVHHNAEYPSHLLVPIIPTW